MINNITDGICIALNAEFSDGYEIYTEHTEQGVTEPCFMVSLLTPSGRRYRGDRHLRENRFVIQYLPASEDYLSECYEVQDRLYMALEVIDIEDDCGNAVKIRGTNMTGEITEEVLSFFVDYDAFVIEVWQKDVMETLTENIEAYNDKNITER